ncbi:unnamed protein product [Miscanthus lutarioriparius]|uniref:AP180 N-terminal homology (ANTH) domain-containing protein n=1 Tax=Miscanthus lutarioriparius TaxID=422564 RepID=A0A811MHD6_9POAL|nr:unnamed protein product [Miscanthus lutarioriparius]
MQSGRQSGDTQEYTIFILHGPNGDAERTAEQSTSRQSGRPSRADGKCRAEHEEAERTPKRRCKPAPWQGWPAGGHEQSSSPAEVEKIHAATVYLFLLSTGGAKRSRKRKRKQTKLALRSFFNLHLPANGMLPDLPSASILQLTVPGDVGKNSSPNFEDDDGDFRLTRNLNKLRQQIWRSGNNQTLSIELVPRVGMAFTSEEDAYRFYNAYARKVGFSIEKCHTKQRADGTLSSKYFVCSNEGGAENVHFLKMDCNNFIGRERKRYLEAQDAQTILEYLENKQVEDPSFYYAVQLDKEDGRICNLNEKEAPQCFLMCSQEVAEERISFKVPPHKKGPTLKDQKVYLKEEIKILRQTKKKERKMLLELKRRKEEHRKQQQAGARPGRCHIHPQGAGRTRYYVIAAKCLALLHHLAATDADPDPAEDADGEGRTRFLHEPLCRTLTDCRVGEPVLALLLDLRDEVHTASWDHSAFVHAYTTYLLDRVCFLVLLLPAPRFADDRVRGPPHTAAAAADLDMEALLGCVRHLRHLLDRLLACRPMGSAGASRVVRAVLHPLLSDSFRVYEDVVLVLALLLDRFFDMDYPECAKAFETYVGTAKQIDALHAFYAWCDDAGVVCSSDIADVRRVDDKLLETMEQFLRQRGRAGRASPPRSARESAVEDAALDNLSQMLHDGKYSIVISSYYKTSIG